MITIFSTPKDFTGEFDIIQRNAFSSWRALSRNIEIIIMGKSKGAKVVTKEIGALYIPDIPLTKQGTPTISGLFNVAENFGNNNYYCFLNSDIILSPSFIDAFQTIKKSKKKFLAVAQRYNIDIDSIIDFLNPTESKRFYKSAEDNAKIGSCSAIDIFCFTKNLYKNIPEFSVGRIGFDNWLVWKARRTFTPVIDMTSSTIIFHQNHSYKFRDFNNHSNTLKSDEAKMNYKLMGTNALNINDANWFLDDGKVKKKSDDEFKQRNLWKISIIFPEFSFFLTWYKRIYRRITNMISLK